MKTPKKQLKIVALFFATLILFQGCSVYHKGTRTLDQATQEQKKVKITTLDNRTIHFKKIVLKDGKYYGVKKLKDSTKDVWLFENDITSIKSKNKTLSTILTVISVTLLGGIITLMATAKQGNTDPINWPTIYF